MSKILALIIVLISPISYFMIIKNIHYWAIDQLRPMNYPTANYDECEYCEGECNG